MDKLTIRLVVVTLLLILLLPACVDSSLTKLSKEVDSLQVVRKSYTTPRIEQEVSQLKDGTFCMTTIAWHKMSILRMHLVYESDELPPGKHYNSWYVHELNDSVKRAQYALADTILQRHLRKIKPLPTKINLYEKDGNNRKSSWKLPH